jgi:hypothetical protein
MNNLNKAAPQYSSKLFNYSKEQNVMSSEISTLAGPLMEQIMNGKTHYGQIYTDSADSGFWIKSENTGKLEAFRFVEEKEQDGDLMFEVYEPINLNLRRAGLRIVIFND